MVKVRGGPNGRQVPVVKGIHYLAYHFGGMDYSIPTN